jgi:predicted nucleic acid-binding protein
VTENFADTFYWLALLNPADQHHERAASFSTDAGIVTSADVQLEVLDALSTHPRLRSLASKFWRRTSQGSDITVVALSPELLDAAVALIDARPDKLWSMTDCISFEIMRARKITNALTADHHFVQAGFQALLMD